MNTNKKPTHYFVYVGHSTATKNKLQEEFHNYLKSLSAKLITADKIASFNQSIIDQSLKLNEQYRRCTPLNIAISKAHFDKGFMINGFYSLTFQILKAYDSN